MAAPVPRPDPENEQPIPAQDSYTQLRGLQQDQLLSQALVPVVDGIRDIATQLGVRPYEIKRVRTRWSGGSIGAGQEFEIDSELILPTPLLKNIETLQEIAQAIGFDEHGAVHVEEISGRFEEDWFFGRDALGNPAPPDMSVYFEIEFRRLDGQPGRRRRFYLENAPMWESDNVMWTMDLKRARQDRSRITMESD
jgi:hypothetical protein